MKMPTFAVLIPLLFVGGAAIAAERTVTLKVDGMTCFSCPYQVGAALRTVPGVSDIEVSLADATATVTFEESLTDITALTSATAAAGFPFALQGDAAARP